MRKVCIVAAKRSPQGRFLGGLAKLSAVELAVRVSKEVLKEIQPEKIDMVIIGNVLSAGLGMNIARQIEVKSGIPIDKTAFTVNMQCASGIQSIILAAQLIQAEQANVILCGGTESMSNVPYLLDKARSGYKLGDSVLIDSILRDGLVDSFDGEHMGLTAECIAEMYKISRIEQDEFALRSQRNYAKAYQEGKYKNEVIKINDLEADEHPRPDTSLEKLATLQPAFKKNGTVTAGNASGINDGAAILVVCDLETAKKNGWHALAIIKGFSSIGCDPKLMGLGPVAATAKICREQKMKTDDFDTIEINEAFAAQTLGCIKEMKLDLERVNKDGGAIALGHPVGTSGARIVGHLAHRISRGETKVGLATTCVGGGQGIAMLLTNPENS